MENLSHEHVGAAEAVPVVVGPDDDDVVGAARPRGEAVRASADALLAAVAEQPPAGLWSKIEAQLRRERVIRS